MRGWHDQAARSRLPRSTFKTPHAPTLIHLGNKLLEETIINVPTALIMSIIVYYATGLSGSLWLMWLTFLVTWTVGERRLGSLLALPGQLLYARSCFAAAYATPLMSPVVLPFLVASLPRLTMGKAPAAASGLA